MKVASSFLTRPPLVSNLIFDRNLRAPSGYHIGNIGDIHFIGTDPASSGCILAQGQSISRTTYAALFAKYGTKFGAGNGSTTFNVPDLQKRVPVGKDGSGTPDTDFDTIGKKGGEKAHTLIESEIPSHNHSVPRVAGTGPTGGLYGAASGTLQENQVSTGSGGGGTHNNMQPYIVLNYEIVAL